LLYINSPNPPEPTKVFLNNFAKKMRGQYNDYIFKRYGKKI
jgi:hypothetical protein